MNDASRPTNRLAQETSAYLRQHMHNPVDWHPWGAEALAQAEASDRPLLVSIGYSACHWCHVMEHESFEDPATADLMNQWFVNVKVDREERPDVDQIYMDTVVGLHGHGGWPLTVFCKPDGTPFYGGTYFPPEPRQGMPAFRQVLAAIDDLWRNRRDEVDQHGTQILAALGRTPRGTATGEPGAETVRQAAYRLLQRADADHGGFGAAPKFPTPVNLLLLLAATDVLPESKAREALDHVVLTCREMSRGGLYDHLGGGFHRYSVDGQWIVPHFEKMLYDQGQLLCVYAEAWRRSGAADPDLLWPLQETVAFLRRELGDPASGFAASLDADSEGEEGTFYVWTPGQVASVLGDDAEAFCHTYDVTRAGSFERGTSVLRDVAREPRERFAPQRAALFAARAEREAPGTDRKRVTAWNALTISGLARAASLTGDPSLLEDATHAADFLVAQLHDADGQLLRVWNEGHAHIPAFLDDHAAFLEALLDLDRAGADARYRTRALAVAESIAGRFFDAAQDDLFLTPDDGERLVHRPRSDHDGAMPQSTGLAVVGLLRAAALSGRQAFDDVARRVLRTHGFVLERAPEAFPTLARAALIAARGLSVAVIVGPPGAPETAALAERARRVLAPEDAVVVTAPGEIPAAIDPHWLTGRDAPDGRATAYVCRGTTCSLPTHAPEGIAPLAAS
ncbi:MAG: thioredoxin domain-containing protein [Myxococcota bacterium]|nr:thioredoxin domain-containing protein [Myxococcota bacterium]